MEDNITATNVINGQKVGWALGSMLYEINTLPWTYIPRKEVSVYNQIVNKNETFHYFLGAVLFVCISGFYCICKSFQQRRRLYKSQYTEIYDIDSETQRG
jgi:hypothetical protein